MDLEEMKELMPEAYEYRRVITESYDELKKFYPDVDWSSSDKLLKDGCLEGIELVVSAPSYPLPTHIYERLRDFYMSDLPYHQEDLDRLESVMSRQRASQDAESEAAEN